MSLVLNLIKPQQLIKNIQIIACLKKGFHKCYRDGLSFRVHFLKYCAVKLEQSEACSLVYIVLTFMFLTNFYHSQWSTLRLLYYSEKYLKCLCLSIYQGFFYLSLSSKFRICTAGLYSFFSLREVEPPFLISIGIYYAIYFRPVRTEHFLQISTCINYAGTLAARERICQWTVSMGQFESELHLIILTACIVVWEF